MSGLLLAIAIVCCWFVHSQGAYTLYQEVQVLEEFYDALQGENWYWRGPSVNRSDPLNVTSNEIGRHIWNFTGYHDPCSEHWQGVNCTCGNETVLYDDASSLCTITSIELENYNLSGQLPDSIGNLSSLTVLDLSFNEINGTIPVTIGNLTNLKFLALSFNNLSSSIPSEIGDCVALEYLVLQKNFLTGKIPDSLFSLAYLYYLDAGFNALTGELSPLIGELTNLQHWVIFENDFTGTIPTEIGNCTKLLYFSIYSNLFHGSIPNGLNISTLNYLYLYNNYLTGPIPDWIGSAVRLQAFDAGENYLSSSIPNAICNVNISLHGLFLNVNDLTGTIPACLGNPLSPMIGMVIEKNYLTGSIPANFSSLVSIQSIILGLNLLSGTIPNFRNAINLEYLYLQENMLTGSLEDIFDTRTQKGVAFLDFSNNQLTGTIPESIYGLKGLVESIALVSNCFSGSISNEFCNMHGLRNFDLDGVHTAKSCQHQMLPFTKSFLMKSHLTGTIPTCLFNLSRIESIHLSGNALDATLPNDLAIGPNVVDITLSHNVLRGNIPVTMQTRNFTTLDLSYNCFGGQIASNFVMSDYTSLEVNRLSGNIPPQFRHAEKVRLLNSNLFGCSFARNSLPLNDPDYSSYQCGSDAFNQSYAIWGIALFVVVGLLIATKLAFMYRTTKLWKKTKETLIKYANLMEEYMAVYKVNDDAKNQDGLVDFALYLTKLRQTFLRTTIIICIGLCPLYYILSTLYSISSYEYSWNASALYLSGEPPAIILLGVFLGFLSFMIWSLREFLQKWLHEDDVIEDATSNERKNFGDKINVTRFLVLCLVASINCAFMLTLNGLYVYFVFKYTTFVVWMCQLIVAIIKVFWNEYVLTWMVRTGREYTKVLTSRPSTMNRLSRESRDSHLSQGSVHSANTHQSQFSQGTFHHCEMDRQRELNELKAIQDQYRLEDARDMPILTFIVIFNTIIAPAIANCVLSDLCYASVFNPPATVMSQGALEVCGQVYSQLSTGYVCLLEPAIYTDAYYSPAFIYRYGCSSAFIRHYASVYVYMFIITGFGKPTGFLTWKYFYDNAKNKYWKKLMSSFLNKLLKEETIDAARLQSEEILFRKERFVLNNVAAICVLLTVGVVFPPIAAVVLFAIYSHTYMNQLIIGRFLWFFEGDQRAKAFPT